MIRAGVCESYYEEILRGVHDAADDYRLALYGKEAALSPATTVYTSESEVTGPGYEAGGRKLAGFKTGRWTHGTDRGSYLTWSSPQWPAATVTAWGGLIYNASKGNKAVCVLAFKRAITSSAAPFDVLLPPPGATALIRVQL